jgi:glutaminyl-peptide cyclotransferase
VRVQEFRHQGHEDAQPRPFWNVMGRFRPEAERWVMLGTHYDTRLWADEDPDPAVRTRPIEGANDGASGTAVLLEIASVLKDIPPEIGVEIVFFDGEDYGRNQRFDDYFLGSTALARDWAAHFGTSRPECVVVLDMVGDADLAFRREEKSQAKSPWVNDLLWSAGGELGIKAFGVAGESPIYDDQDAFLQMGIPAALLIDYEYPWWHTQGDTADKCSPESLRATGRVVLAAMIDRPVKAPQGG